MIAVYLGYTARQIRPAARADVVSFLDIDFECVLYKLCAKGDNGSSYESRFWYEGKSDV